MFSLRCNVCGMDNPDKNQFCNSCGRPLPKPQTLTNPPPTGAVQVQAPATPKSSGTGLILLAGGLFFLIAMIAAGFFVVLPLLAEEDTPSWTDSSLSSGTPGSPGDLADSENFENAADSQGSLVSGSGDNPGSFPVAPTATRGVLQPAQGSSASPDDIITGTWEIRSSTMQMQFGADGVATLRDSTSGDYATGSWEKISDGRYRLWSPSGTQYPLLLADPIAGTMYFEDYSMVFIRKG